MAIQSGIVSSVTISPSAGGTGVDISAYTTTINIGTPTNLQDITTLDKVAIARLALLADFTVQLGGQYAPELNAVFKNDTGIVRAISIGLSNNTETVTGNVLLGDYQPFNRDQSGNAVWTATLANQDGVRAGWS